MSSDLVDTLRKLAAIDNCQVSLAAADKIERLNEYIKRQAMDIILCKNGNDMLHEENTRLRAALHDVLGWHDYSNDMHKPIEVRAAYMRARAALEEGRT